MRIDGREILRARPALDVATAVQRVQPCPPPPLRTGLVLEGQVLGVVQGERLLLALPLRLCPLALVVEHLQPPRQLRRQQPQRLKHSALGSEEVCAVRCPEHC